MPPSSAIIIDLSSSRGYFVTVAQEAGSAWLPMVLRGATELWSKLCGCMRPMVCFSLLLNSAKVVEFSSLFICRQDEELRAIMRRPSTDQTFAEAS